MKAACAAIFLSSVIGKAQAPSFQFERFDFPGAARTTVSAVNNTGQILGQYELPRRVSHDYLRNPDGSFVTLELRGSPTGINNAGQIVGTYIDNTVHGFVSGIDGRNFTSFDGPGLNTQPYAINDRGEIVGDSVYRETPNIGGFLRSADGTTFTSIRMPGAASTHPRGINNQGEIVGWYNETEPGGPAHGFLRTAAGIYSTIDVPGGTRTLAMAINNRGQIAGSIDGGHGFVRNADGSFVLFDVPISTPALPTATGANGINDRGVVAGSFSSTDSHGFIASPVAGGTDPAIRPILGITSASAFGGLRGAAPGSWIEIFGQNLAGTTREWRASDFTGDRAPASLDGVSVTIGGRPAFLSYISPGQINAQIPFGLADGQTADVIVTREGRASEPQSLEVGSLIYALFVIPTAGANDYLAATFSDQQTYVLPPGARPSLPSRHAKPGDAIVLYGIGFGPVEPDIPAGQIAAGLTQLRSRFEIRFAGVPAVVTYAGMAPGTVGLYQFNVIVPEGAVPEGQSASDAVPVTFFVDGRQSPFQRRMFTALTR